MIQTLIKCATGILIAFALVWAIIDGASHMHSSFTGAAITVAYECRGALKP